MATVQEIAQEVLSQLKADGTQIENTPIVESNSELNSLLAMGKDGKMKRITPNDVIKEDIEREYERAVEAEQALAAKIVMETESRQEIEQAIFAEIGMEAESRQAADNNFNNKAVLFGGFSNRQTDSGKVVLSYKSVNEVDSGVIEIPAATTETAGVMSAADKEKLNRVTAQQETITQSQNALQLQVNNIKPIEIKDSNIVNAPDEEDITMVDSVLKLKDRAAGSALGYKIVRKRASMQLTEFLDANTIYEIRYDINLLGATLTIPEYCTLNFVGGKITNGTIVGNKTNLTGNISVDKIEGSFACEIKSTYSSCVADYAKLKMLLELKIDTLILDEDFYVAEDEEYTSPLVSEIPTIKGTNITINVDTIHTIKNKEGFEGDFFFVNCRQIKLFEGVCFDFKAMPDDFNERKGKTRGVGIVTSPIATIRDVTIKNIKGSNVVNALSITCNKEEATMLKAENITLSNLSTIGDKTIGNSDGYLYAFNLSINKDNSHILLKNITFNNIVAWDKDGNYNSGDAGSFYVHVDGATGTDDSVSANRSNVVFDGINAVNPGYRLIKTDCKFVTVKNVIAKRTTEGEKSNTMTLIGFNNGDGAISDGYAIVDNVHFEGDASVIISVALPDGEVSNVTAKLKNFSTASSLLSAYNRLAVKNCTFINGGVLCQGPQNEATAKPLDIRMKNITVDRTDNEWSSFCMFNSYTSNKLEISNFRINNYLLTNEYKGFSSRVGVSEYIFRNIYITNNINNGSWIFSFSNKTNLTLLNTCFKGYARGIFGLNDCARLLVDELNYEILGTTQGTIVTYGQIYLTNKDGYYCLKNVKGSVAQSPREWSPSFQSKVVENEETIPVEFKFHNVDFRTPVIVKDRYIYWTTEYVRAGDPSTLADQYGYLPQIDGVKTTIEVKGIGRVNCEYRYGGWNIVDGVANTIAQLKGNDIPFANGTSVYVKDLGKPVWWNGSAWVDSTGATV